jgi:membrane protease YdiL (CAAX protease family)
MPLLLAFHHIRNFAIAERSMRAEPQTLREKKEQQYAGDELRRAESLAVQGSKHVVSVTSASKFKPARSSSFSSASTTQLTVVLNSSTMSDIEGSVPDAASTRIPPVPATTPAVPKKPVLHTIFLGPNGLRAGWRLALYILFTFGLGWLIHEFRLHVMHVPTPKPETLIDPYREVWSRMRAFAVVAIPALIMARIERGRWSDYGLPLNRIWSRETLIGFVWGFGGLSLLMGIMRAFGVYHIDGFAIHGSDIWRFAAVWGVGFIFVALFEEFFTRGYMQYTLASGIGFWPAAVLLSALFFAGHIKNPGETPWGLVDVFLAGLFFCFVLWRTGNLWFAVALHAAWDWGLTYFYSVPDSGMMGIGHLLNVRLTGPVWLTGGSAGPEGSVINLIFDILWFPIFALLYPHRKWVGIDDRRRAAQGSTVPAPVTIDTSALSS